MPRSAGIDVKEMSADPPYWAQQLQQWADTYGAERVLAFNTGVRKRMAQACSSVLPGGHD
jgi:hypothetical protein